jgi:hypothetical protein
MKITLAMALFAPFLVTAAIAQTVHVRTYTKADGTVVQEHDRTAPNATRADNWSSKPNVNPENGKVGTVDPYAPVTPRTPRRW